MRRILTDYDAVGNPGEVEHRGGPEVKPAADLALVAEARPASEEKSLHASERDTEVNRKQREEFVAHIRTISAKRLILLGESGVTTSMTGLRARCQAGRRTYEATPGGHWKILTILGAMSLDGSSSDLRNLLKKQPVVSEARNPIASECPRNNPKTLSDGFGILFFTVIQDVETFFNKFLELVTLIISLCLLRAGGQAVSKRPLLAVWTEGSMRPTMTL